MIHGKRMEIPEHPVIERMERFGERCERRRWRMKRAERVAAVKISRANSE